MQTPRVVHGCGQSDSCSEKDSETLLDEHLHLVVWAALASPSCVKGRYVMEEAFHLLGRAVQQAAMGVSSGDPSRHAEGSVFYLTSP